MLTTRSLNPVTTFMRLVFALALVGATLSGCSSNDPTEPKEIREGESDPENSVSVDTPEEQLIRQGKRLYFAGLYSLAREHFDSLRNGYPTSPWVEFAEIKSADARFESREFAEAAAQYEEFTRNRPASKAAPYMWYRAGRSFQMMNKGAGRDVKTLSRALELYNEFLSKWPDSVYAESVRKFRAEVAALLAEHEEKILAFYEKKDKDRAAKARAQAISDKWKPLVAETAYAPSYQVVAPEGIVSANVDRPARVQVGEPRSPSTAGATEGNLQPGFIRVLRATCSQSGARGAMIFLDKPLRNEDLTRKIALPAKGVDFVIPGASSKGITMDCFGSGDLTISPAGRVTWATPLSVTGIVLDNPNRIFLSAAE